MSWICFQIELPQNKEKWEQKVKEECDRMLTQEAHEDNGFWYPKMEVIKSCIYKEVYYVAFRTITLSGKCHTKAAVFKIRIQEHSTYNLFCCEKYEEDFPQDQECPLSILQLLGNTKSQSALEWRKKCYEFHGILNEKITRKNIYLFQKKSQFNKRPRGSRNRNLKNFSGKKKAYLKISKNG